MIGDTLERGSLSVPSTLAIRKRCCIDGIDISISEMCTRWGYMMSMMCPCWNIAICQHKAQQATVKMQVLWEDAKKVLAGGP